MLPLYFMLIMTFHPRPALASSKSATFELSLYTTITEVSPRDSNLALSSLSAQNAVLMAHLGSCNATRSEFETLFSVPRSRVSADSIIKNHLRVIQTKVPRMSHLLSANAAFLDSKYSINPKYRNALERIFHANVTSLGISSNPDAAVRVVNSFVARVTKNNIPEILAPGGLKPTDKIVLVNALYFKARWLQPFDRQHTAYKRFTQESGEVKSVPTMNLRGAFNYFESEKIGAQFLELSYANSTTKMILVLPLQRGNLSAVEQAMSTVEGEKVFAKRWPKKTVIVILPKFRITQTLDLKEVLERMGVKKAFSASTADFCGISKHNDLYISKAVQKVFVGKSVFCIGLCFMLMLGLK